MFDEVDELTEDEKKELFEKSLNEWFEKSSNELLQICDHRPDLAQQLVKKFADYFGPSDEYGPLLKSRIEMDRKGKPSHRPKRRKSDYYAVLMFYAASIPDGREITLERLSKAFKVSPQSVPNLVTKARRLAKNGELVFEPPSWVKEAHHL